MKLKNARLWNDDWKFCLGDGEEAVFTAPDCDDADWRTLSLPHDWDAEYAPDQEAKSGAGGGYARAGIGWYRKHFRATQAQSERLITSLIFEGVYMDCDVYLNGAWVGGHGYGYTSFEVDLTKELVSGDNVLAVRVDNSRQPNSRWYTGSGIYRDVYLRVAELTHLALYGVRAETNGIYPEYNSASITLRATVENDDNVPMNAELKWRLKDASGKAVSGAGASLRVEEYDQGFTQSRMSVESPRLWSVEDPYLYTLTTTLLVEGRVMDERTERIGIRTILFDEDRGFLLNNERVKIKGVCLHHDSGLFGAAFHTAVWRERLILLKEMGVNGVRCSHNPPAPGLLDLCDELGFVVMDEIFDEWLLGKNKNENYFSEKLSYGYGQFFGNNARDDLLTMLKRDYNHPSVVLWSIGNEIPEQSSADGAEIVRYLSELVHRQDPMRLVTSACDNIAAPAPFAALNDFTEALDVVGYNYVGRWRERAERYYEDDRIAHPKRRFIGTENPSVPTARGNYALDGSYNINYLSAPVTHEALWRFTASRDYIAGDFIWTGVDYLGEAHWPMRGAAFGPIDTAGFVKDAYYYFRSIWNEKKTTLHLLPHWNWRGDEGKFKQVVCYTSCERVRLYLNGRLVGEKGSAACPRYGAVKRWDEEQHRYHPTTNDLHLVWDVPYEPGTLRAEGFAGEKRVAVCEVTTTGSPAALSVKKRRWGEFIAVEVVALDNEGREVPDASPIVFVKCGRGVRLIGMDAGDLSDPTAWSASRRRMCAGKLLAILVGKGMVTFSARGLQNAQLDVEGGHGRQCTKGRLFNGRQ